MGAAERAAEALKGYCRDLANGKDVPTGVMAAVIRHEYEPLVKEVERILDGMTPMMLPKLRELLRRTAK